MRLCRIEVAGVPRWGLIEEELVTPLAVPPWEGVRKLGGALPLATARLLPPCEPTKIVAVGLNYRAHAAEMGKELPAEPLLFLKAPSSLVAPGGIVVVPRQSQRVEHEGELALVIGRAATKVNAGQALEHVLGYTCLDDVTARDIQRREKVYARAKGFDTFCPVGPWLETGIADPQALDIELVARHFSGPGSTVPAPSAAAPASTGAAAAPTASAIASASAAVLRRGSSSRSGCSVNNETGMGSGARNALISSRATAAGLTVWSRSREIAQVVSTRPS